METPTKRTNRASWVVLTALLLWTGCATNQRCRNAGEAVYGSNFICRAKPGAEMELEKLLREAWETCLNEGRVFARPHFVLRYLEDDRTCYLELYAWVEWSAQENPSSRMKALWDQIYSLCETKGGKPGVEWITGEVLAP